ncbi:uncharacterized protein LOC100383731 [Zea mays]|jgi:hypothetical protein|uniref:Uncharacterized protein n=1 Tax=Zea mays TaxID=4577 RepID=C0PIM6_MAIZE|nr:uncharacterized protein LOC100383731 [Zea mays]ACN35042.1 unknown [Zea mays]|eukprot:NP_001169839.1 uncharacterized protein LOC100383731 [Zea mays]
MVAPPSMASSSWSSSPSSGERPNLQPRHGRCPARTSGASSLAGARRPTSPHLPWPRASSATGRRSLVPQWPRNLRVSCDVPIYAALPRAIDLCSLDVPSSLTVCLSYAAPSLFPLVATKSCSTRSSGAALSSLWGLLGSPCFKMSSNLPATAVSSSPSLFNFGDHYHLH